MFEKSCGAIVFDNENVLLVKQIDGTITFPKGHVENNETEVETAMREVLEETNVKIKINPNYRYTVTYSPRLNVTKEVVYFLATKIGGNIMSQEGEISEVFWVNKKDVIENLMHEDVKKVYNKLLDDLKGK